MTDLVAVWDVALSDGVHKIEFEHGTTSGKRVVYVDGKVGKTVTSEIWCTGKLDFANVDSSYVNARLFSYSGYLYILACIILPYKVN